MIDVLAAKSVLDIMASKDAIYLDQPFLCSTRSWELNAFILRQTWQRNRNYWAHVALFKCALCQTFVQQSDQIDSVSQSKSNNRSEAWQKKFRRSQSADDVGRRQCADCLHITPVKIFNHRRGGHHPFPSTADPHFCHHNHHHASIAKIAVYVSHYHQVML